MSIRKGDRVVVISGKDKGKKGNVIDVSETEKGKRVVVDGVNMVVKHKKARNTKQKSTREKKPASIDASNVMILCKCGEATRVKNVIGADGVKHRTCSKCGEILDKKFVKTKEKARSAEEVKEDDKKEEKKPLQRREVKAFAESKVKASQVTGGAANMHRQLGGGA